MSTKHQTLPPIVVPFDGTSTEAIQAGRHVQELLEHPGFAALDHAIEGYREMIENRVSLAPKDNPAYYADALGERRGLAEVERIARGVVENAKFAEAAERQAEEGGQ